MKTKTCRTCDEHKPTSEFSNKGHYVLADGTISMHLAPDCKPCRAHKEKLARYGLSQADFDALMGRTRGQCEICGSAKDVVIDHCHGSGRVRGILCQLCNTGLGLFKDNPVFLRNAISYLSQT